MVPIPAIVAKKLTRGTAVDRLKARMTARFEAEKQKPRDLRLSQEKLAEKLGISPGTISEQLSGLSAQRGLLHHLDAIADYFNVPPTLLIHRNDTNLMELRREEHRLVQHLRTFPPAVRDQVILLFDYFAGLLPEEREQRQWWLKMRRLPDEQRALVQRTLDEQYEAWRQSQPARDTGPAAQASVGRRRASNDAGAERTPKIARDAARDTTRTASDE